VSATAKLADVAKIVMGQSPPSTSYNDVGEGLPFYQGKTDFGATYPTPRIYCREPKKLAESGDILMSVRAPVGATNLCDRQSCIGRGIAAIRAKGIDRDFLYFYLKEIEDYIDSLGSGAIFKAINKSQLATLPINKAGIPLPEQRKIAHILSTVQRAIEEQERIIQTATELKKALMHKLFTEGLRNEPQKQTEIGPVPESWEVVELGEVLTIAQYGMSVKGSAEGNHPILRMTNQIEGQIVGHMLQYVKINDSDFEKFKVQKGDILFNRTNSLDLVGRTAIFDIEGDFVFASYLIRLRTDEKKLNPFFLNCYFNTDEIQARLKSIATRAVSQSNISATRLKGFLVPLPHLDEQAQIVEHSKVLDRKLDVARQKQAALQDLFNTLLHELMTAKIRVHELEFKPKEAPRKGAQGKGAQGKGARVFQPVGATTDRNVRAPLPLQKETVQKETGAQGKGAQETGARVFQPVEVKAP
jgi:type I restriction enzyme S subunit